MIDLTSRRVLKQDAKSNNNCNICGGDSFTTGPMGRMSRNENLPCCTSCQSLERHRTIRHFWEFLATSYPLGQLSILQFSKDQSVEPGWFQSVEVSQYGGENHLDMQSIDRPDDHYDIAVVNHVLEHVADDRLAYSELLRVVKPTGLIQMNIPNPFVRPTTNDWGYPKEEQHGHYRLYGRDVHPYLKASRPDVALFEIRCIDPCTAVNDYIYVATLDAKVCDAIFTVTRTASDDD